MRCEHCRALMKARSSLALLVGSLLWVQLRFVRSPQALWPLGG